MRSYRRLAENFASSVGAAGTTGSEERAERAERLSQLTYDNVLRDRVAYGTPDMVVDRLRHLRDVLGVSGVIIGVERRRANPARARAQLDSPLRARGRSAPAYLT